MLPSDAAGLYRLQTFKWITKSKMFLHSNKRDIKKVYSKMLTTAEPRQRIVKYPGFLKKARKMRSLSDA